MIRLDRRSLTMLLLLLALTLGIVTVLAERLIFAAALARTVDLDEVDVLGLNAALAAIPFVYLAFRPRRLPWLAAVAATAAVHGWWLAKGIAYQRAPDGTGVPILGAVLMLLSPFAIFLLAGALNLSMSRRGNGR